MNNWKPIETAPKDRRILLAYPYSSDAIGVGYYAENIGVFFSEFQGGHSTDTIIRNQPIAWQELPKFDGVIDGK
jgi:hypothetical protein